MAVERKTRPTWVEEVLREVETPPSPGELARRRRVMARTWRHRAKITPDTTGQYVRELRGPLPDKQGNERAAGN